MTVAYNCNTSYLEDKDKRNHGLKPAWTSSSWDPISKIPNIEKDGGEAQVIEYLPSKGKVLSQTPILQKKKKKITQSITDVF
jgi:hypothetical protein